ncbi:hypothetical protein BDF22DRAFT_680251 [Syncephalis plumigaleata]|nr:hypothetical protein BDF22DRAFT_680251 [Syncephalis plumigaleata]
MPSRTYIYAVVALVCLVQTMLSTHSLFLVNAMPSVQTELHPPMASLPGEEYEHAYPYVDANLQDILNDMNNQRLLTDTRKVRIALANRWIAEFAKNFGNQLMSNLGNQITGIGMDMVSVVSNMPKKNPDNTTVISAVVGTAIAAGATATVSPYLGPFSGVFGSLLGRVVAQQVAKIAKNCTKKDAHFECIIY